MCGKRGGELMAALMMLAVLAGRAHACGPFFPNRLMVGGDSEVLAAPVAEFEAELDRIRPPLPVEFSDSVSSEWQDSIYLRGRVLHYGATARAGEADLKSALGAGGRDRAGQADLVARYVAARGALRRSLEKRAAWTSMRNDVDTYRKAGAPPSRYLVSQWQALGIAPASSMPPPLEPSVAPAGLPAEFAHYFQGAIDYYAGESERARAEWEYVLRLPARERRYRSTWAAFMLGKLALGDDLAEARRRFRQVRQLATDGFVDSLGLALSSLGWEGMACLRQKAYAEAIELYLAQYAAGEPSAMDSLGMVSGEALSQGPQVLAGLARNTTARRVITAYILSQGGPYSPSPAVEQAERWLRALEAAPAARAEEAERFAWAAYQVGDVALAARWLKMADPEAPMGRWIRAKLLLRDGKVREAAAQLSLVVRALQQADDVPVLGGGDGEFAPPTAQGRASGELGVLLVSQQQYEQALDALLRGGFWEDAAYVAERVLTSDELKEYVDGAWPPPADGAPSDTADESLWSYGERGPREAIRYLLARRLARAGRFAEARPYYPPDLWPHLDLYARAIRRCGQAGLTSRQKAAALWCAASIARHEGMQLLGYELEADWFVYDGQLTAPEPLSDRVEDTGSTLTRASEDERRRFRQSAPAIDKRFHYRYVAADLAWRAICLMPDNDDLTASMLWVAGSWLKARDPQAADRFYKALVRRCGRTDLGQQADALHWFPPEGADEAAVMEALAHGDAP